MAFKYIGHLLSSSNRRGHGIHSPFLYAFVREVLKDDANSDAFQIPECLRNDMLKDHRILHIDDMGAGSAFERSTERSVSSIARNAAKPPRFGRLLYRLIRYYQPGWVLELGTSLGVSTAYMASADHQKKVYSIEGCRAIASVATDNFHKKGLTNIQLIQGNFDEVLAPRLREWPAVEFVFIDGNHQKRPTLHYFQLLMQRRSKEAIFVFDDIHWSSEMEEAWAEILRSPEIKMTVDLFFVGIVFFHSSFRVSQHFKLPY